MTPARVIAVSFLLVLLIGAAIDETRRPVVETVLHAPAPLGLLVIQDIGGMK